MHVYMSEYMHICMTYACMYVIMYVCMHVHMHACMYNTVNLLHIRFYVYTIKLTNHNAAFNASTS